MAASDSRGSRLRLLALALASGKGVRDAAADAGVSVRTAHRAMATDRFRRHLRRVHEDMRAAVVRRLTTACTRAVDTLLVLLDDGVTAQVRLGASRAILEHAGRMAEVVSIEERLRDLEAREPVGG